MSVVSVEMMAGAQSSFAFDLYCPQHKPRPHVSRRRRIQPDVLRMRDASVRVREREDSARVRERDTSVWVRERDASARVRERDASVWVLQRDAA